MIVGLSPVLTLCFLLFFVSWLLRLDFRRFALFFSLVCTVGIVISGPIISVLGFGLLWYFPVLPRSHALYFIHLFHSSRRQSTAVVVSETIGLLLLWGFLITGLGFCRSFRFPVKRYLLGFFLIIPCWLILTAMLWGYVLA